MYRLTHSVGEVHQVFEADTLTGVMDLYKAFEEHQRWLKTPRPPTLEEVTKVRHIKEPELKVWGCQIAGYPGTLPVGSDAPMRAAVELAYRELTGHEADVCFSGWGDELTPMQLAVMRNRR